MVYHIPQGMANLWAPELHAVRGNLYIYFAMDDGNNDYHRMYVIKAYNSSDPMGQWGPAKRLYTEDEIDYWAIDGTIFEYNSKLYFIWSGWPDVNVGFPQNLYIAEMCDPETICSKRVLLREPKFDWEGPLLEGPYILQRAGRVFLVFSAHTTWGPDYCLGIMGIDNQMDVMDSYNWWHNNDGCVFYRNDNENVFCTGHASFTTSTDYLETWIVFHATNDVNDPGSRRVARVEKLDWDSNNMPIFPRPSGDSIALQVPSGQLQETYINPVLDGLSADPSAILIGGWYYFVVSTNTERELTILKSRWLTDFREAERSVAYSAPPEHSNVWAAEMHMIRGELYMYFTQDKTGESHRNYVIKANDPNNPMNGWSAPTRLMPEDDHFSIDGTVLQYSNGRLYYIYCSVDDGVPMSLYIAPMSSPMKISGPRVLLRSPHSEWDNHGGPVNEGPFIVRNADRVFLVFSGSSTWTPDYCLSMMGIDNVKDPLVRSNWWDDLDRCVFFKNEEEGIYTTGHASFTSSPDGTETWMLYHATDDPNSNEYSTRIARADRITWAEDHAPIFPRPTNQRRPAPSGQTLVLPTENLGVTFQVAPLLLIFHVIVYILYNLSVE
ncbi:Alpha-L-arabinofuranosidase B [Pseudolycoriella hygida]|uniref:Alpha-L-arabinofuranosidase B n=1 Tax=Pseudolycoriella hygida TaxID=35572 RepID=A0A9Q0MKQ1_9DIPT|nr:Alpha-L-arabinofuranosidase B [Pseudolycoriella hygida]